VQRASGLLLACFFRGELIPPSLIGTGLAVRAMGRAYRGPHIPASACAPETGFQRRLLSLIRPLLDQGKSGSVVVGLPLTS